MTGLPHQRRWHSSDFVEPKRVRGIVTVLAIVLAAAALDLVCLIWGIRIGRDLQRAEDLRGDAKKSVDAAKPAYGLKQFTCSGTERHEYLEACRQRMRSNLTPKGF